MNQTSKSKHYPARYHEETEEYWKKHTDAAIAGGYSKSAYCKANQVNYARFCYWSNRRPKSQKNICKNIELLPVQIANENKVNKIHCTLILKNGLSLEIYNQESLHYILMVCV